MPYVRAKRQKSRERERTYYYLVESYRENGRVRQRTLAYLGKYSSMEDALARLPQDIERRKGKTLPRVCQWRDEAKAAYEEELAWFSKPFVGDETSHSPRHLQERWYWESRESAISKRGELAVAENKYRGYERKVNYLQAHIAELEARLVKLQELSRQVCSSQEMVGTNHGQGVKQACSA
jgi:hypothetical protein